MSTYVLLYSGGKMPTNDIERQKVTDEWMDWYKKLDKAVIDQGNPFTPMGKTIYGDGRISNDPECDSLSGYTIIQAMSIDQAIQLAKSCPALHNGSRISVYETFNAM